MLKVSLNQFNKKKKSKLKKSKKTRLELIKENRLKKVGGGKFFKKIRFGKRFKQVMLVLVGVVLIGISIGVVILLSIFQEISNQVPTPDKVFIDVPLATEIYDRHGLDGANTGTALYKLFGESNSDKVDIKDIPDTLKAAFMAAEDDNFYNHHGYDPTAILRCAFNTVTKRGNCGASTITQQLVKLSTRNNENTLDRKIREILTAIKVEDSSTKDQIMEMYLRLTPYGSNIVGIKSAAAFYFWKDPAHPELGGKEPKDLTLAESAALAGIVQNPSVLSPTLGADPEQSQALLKDRMSYIFDQLKSKKDQINAQLKKNSGSDQDVLTDKMIDDARNEDWTKNLRPPIATDIKAGHFVNYVLQQLQSGNYNNGQPFKLSELQTGGYKIYTTLDYDLQKTAEGIVQKAGDDYTYWNMHNAALMTTQPATGQIITMVGSKNFYGQSEGCDGDGQNCLFDPQVNIMTSFQSPGSTNKPLGYYLAFKDGKLAPGSVLPDVPITIGGYNPKDWDGRFMGPHNSAASMLQQSRNIPAITVVQMDGVDNYVNTAREWGYTTYTGDYGPSVVIGGTEVLPVEHVQAFGVFANGGDLVPLNPILKIVDKDGKTIYTASPQRKQVGDPQGVWLLNQSLYKLNSLGDNIAFDDRDIAGKTGTTEDNKSALIMVWSPDFVTLAWSGNNNNSPMDPNYGYPVYVVMPWMMEYMRDIAGTPYLTPKTQFTRPGFVYQGGGSNDCDAKGECEGIEGNWLIQGREPPRGDFTRKKVTVCTDQQDHLARPIDIATGNSMVKEFIYYKDPYPDYQHFVDDYMAHNGITNGGPQANCTIDRSGGVTGPFFKFTTIDGSSGNKLNLQGGIYTTTAGGSITTLKFFLNGVDLDGVDPTCAAGALSKINSFDVTCDVSSMGLDSGTYKFKASATDSGGLTNTLNPPNGVNVVIGSGTSSKFSFTATPPTPLQYSATTCVPLTNVGFGACKYPITVTYSGGSLDSGSVKLCELKNGTLTGCTAMSGNGPYNLNGWGTAITGPGTNPDDYKFYVTATANGGLVSLQSAQSTDVSVTP